MNTLESSEDDIMMYSFAGNRAEASSVRLPRSMKSSRSALDSRVGMTVIVWL